MKNSISDLRNTLFAVIQELQDPEENSTMTVEKAQTIAELGKVIIDSAKVEVLAYRASNGAAGLADGFVLPSNPKQLSA